MSRHEARWKKREIAAALQDVMHMQLKGINEILAVRASAKRDTQMDTLALFETYLKETEALVRFVDALDR